MNNKPNIDLTGQRFGRLVVTGYVVNPKATKSTSSRFMWTCRCDCGAMAPNKSSSTLKSPLSKNYGCASCVAEMASRQDAIARGKRGANE